MNIKTPAFFLYYARTFKLEDTEDGGWRGMILNLTTGDFDEENRIINRVLFSTSGEIHSLNEAEFVDETEQARQHYLVGEGPIFALYATIDGIYDSAESEGRQITDEELAYIRLIRQGTFKMWDEEFARRRAGEPGQNTYTDRKFGAPSDNPTEEAE